MSLYHNTYVVVCVLCCKVALHSALLLFLIVEFGLCCMYIFCILHKTLRTLLCKVNCVMCLNLPSHTQGRKIEATPLAMYNLFIERVRQNLHIVLAMSPIGDTFRSRLRMFPSLISCCTIDWFHVSGNLWCACVPPCTMSTVAVRCGMSEVYLVTSRCSDRF